MMKQLFFAGLVSLGLAALAQAQTTNVYLTGSTAYRGAVHTALKNRLQNVTIGFTGSSFTGAGQAIFEGDVSGNHVIVKTSWSGSVGGVQAVSTNLAIPFLPDGTGRSSGAGTGSATTATAANGGDVVVPDMTMSDTFPGATKYNSNNLIDRPVGVVEFKWVASADAPAGLNMTPQLARSLFTGLGYLPLSLFTGVAGDATTKVYATGRDADSGTRLTALAETGVGVFKELSQWKPNQDGSGNITSTQLWPAGNDTNGNPFNDGDGGYASGGTLAGVLTKPSIATTGGFYVTYLSTGDANTAITGGAKEMTYSGVSRGADTTNTIEGKYTFWAYEHLIYKSTLTGAKKSLADALEDQLKTTDATLKISAMKVSRQQDGGAVKP